jgi:hypothetical protein
MNFSVHPIMFLLKRKNISDKNYVEFICIQTFLLLTYVFAYITVTIYIMRTHQYVMKRTYCYCLQGGIA